MDTMEKTQRLNRTIPCQKCGELYSISYKRCPFCGGTIKKRLGTEPASHKAGAHQSSPHKPVPPKSPAHKPSPPPPHKTPPPPAPEELRGKGELANELPEDFSADIDWTPELDDGILHVPTTRGGKRLAKRNPIPLKRVLAVVISVLLVAAAAYIIVTRVVPYVQGCLEARSEKPQEDPLPPAQTDGENPPDGQVQTGGEEGTTDGKATVDEPVLPPAASSFRLLDTQLSLTQVGERRQLTAAYEGEGEMGDLSWASSDAQIASVAEDGTLTAMKPGTVTISATRKADGTVAQCEVSCLWEEDVPAVNLSLNKSDFSLRAGEPDVTMRVIGSKEQPNWTVEDPAVVTISPEGIVKYVGKGTTRVVASVGGQTLFCIVRCK